MWKHNQARACLSRSLAILGLVIIVMALAGCTSASMEYYCPHEISEADYALLRKTIPVHYFPLETVRSSEQYPGGVYKYCNNPQSLGCIQRNRNPFTDTVYDRIILADVEGSEVVEIHEYCHVHEVVILGVSLEDTHNHKGWDRGFLRL